MNRDSQSDLAALCFGFIGFALMFAISGDVRFGCGCGAATAILSGLIRYFATSADKATPSAQEED